MEVRAGYKQTEVGVIPEEWEVLPIQAVASVRTGPFGSALHEKDYVQDGTPIITVEHLGDFGVTHSNLPMVSDADRLRLKTFSLQNGDIVFSRVGSIDRNALISEEEDGWLFSGRLLRIRVTSNKAHAPFLSYYFHSEPFIRRVRNVAVGQTMPSLNTQIISNIDIILPPLPEQRAIAAALSDVDALLTTLNALIAKKRSIKQAAMQELLTGKTRLPDFQQENAKLIQTDIGWLPEDWDYVSIGQIAEVKGGKRLPLGKSLSETPTPYPYIRVTDMYFGGVNLEDIKYVPEDVFPIIKNYRISSEDIFISVAGTLGIVGKIPIELNGANLTENADKITNISCDRDFLLYNLMSERIQNLIKAGKTVGAQPKLALGRIKSFLVATPQKIEEQTAIATILSDMDAEIAALERQREKTGRIKQGMMQELLTGKTRLG